MILFGRPRTSIALPYAYTRASLGVDVYNWDWPENWYSIYDANANSETDPLGYEYFAYENEFLGDAQNQIDWTSDAIYPSIIRNRTSISTGTNTPCSNVPGIKYPLTRIVGLEKYEDNLIKVYPNPSVNEFWVNYKVGDKNHVDLRIIDINGDLILSKSNFDLRKSIDISSLSPGYYIIRIRDSENKMISESNILIK